MSRCVLLDTSVLGVIANPKPSASTLACRQWMELLVNHGVRVIIPGITDYELRRELLRAHKTRGLRNLDSLILQVEYLPLTTVAMRQAAAFWAEARQQGYPTAHHKNLDGDMILAAQAATLGVADFIVATTNIRHLARFVPAGLWQAIS